MKKIIYSLLLFSYQFVSAQSTLIKTPISNGNDDVEVSTAFLTASNDLELGGFEGGVPHYVALRFQNVQLPANALISKAYIQFTTKAANSATSSVTIQCQKGHATAYVATENLLARSYSGTNVEWTPAAWTKTNEATVKQQTPSLLALVQDAVQTGWQSGNALSFILKGRATTTNVLNAVSYETKSNKSGVAQLVIEYSVNPCLNDATVPVFSNCPANMTVQGNATSGIATWTSPTLVDNCPQNVTSVLKTSPTENLASGSVFPIGTTTVSYEGSDAAGNKALPCVFTVEVVNVCLTDTVAPTFSNCPKPINLIATNETGAVASWTAPTVSDICTEGITPSVISSPREGLGIGSEFPIGITTVTYTAYDAANNVAKPCSFKINVLKSSNLFINEVAPQGTKQIPSDWIELYNSSDTVMSLDDVYIAGKRTAPFKWRLKNLSIPAKGFLILLADKDTLLGPTHIDMKLGITGEKIYLFRKVNDTTAQELAYFELPQTNTGEDNVTFGGITEGEPPLAPSLLTKFLGGTPNAPNATSPLFIKITNSLKRGIVTEPSVAVLTAPQGSTIRYTLDHTTPSATTGLIYTEPIPITQTTVLKTFVYTTKDTSKVEAFTYIFPVKGAELKFPTMVTPAEYESGLKLLPIISFSSTVGLVESKTEKMTSFEYISKFGETKSVSAICGVKGYGNDSYLNSEQKNLRASFKTSYGFSSLVYPIFKRDDVDTYNPVEKFKALDLKIGQDGPNEDGFGMTMTSQGLISKTMREMGNIDLHTQYVHCFINGKYNGIYTLKEHFDDDFGKAYYNGEEYDYINSAGGFGVGSVSKDSKGLPQGSVVNWNALRTAATQKNFQLVKNYLNVNQYIDMMLTMMYFDNEWEFRAIADPKLLTTKFVVENHDTDGALTKLADNNSFAYDLKWTRANYALILNGPGGIFGNLMRSGNKEFATLVRDRVYDAFQRPNGALTSQRIIAKLEEMKAVLRPTFFLELARFNATFYNTPYYDKEYDIHVAHMPIRYQYNLDKWASKGLKHTLSPITFDQPSGNVTTAVLATNPNVGSTIYYTLDGTDPMGNDGVISPVAKLYTNNLELVAGVNNVVARPYFNTEFGPKTKAVYTSATAISALRIAEILNVEAKLDGKNTLINWQTKTTDENSHFKIEKRNKNGVFETIKTVSTVVSNNRKGLESYNIVDENTTEGDNVYRVTLLSDVVKTPQYSEVVKVNYSPQAVFALYPNPASRFVDVDLRAVQGERLTISIVNNIGQTVYTEKVESAASKKRLEIDKLDVGQYIISIQPEGKQAVATRLNVVR